MQVQLSVLVPDSSSLHPARLNSPPISAIMKGVPAAHASRIPAAGFRNGKVVMVAH